MLNKTTISEKLVTYFLLLNITAVLIIGLLSHINSKQALNRRTFDQLNSVRFVKKRHIENFFRDRINEAAYFSEDDDFGRLAADPALYAGLRRQAPAGAEAPGMTTVNSVRKIFEFYRFYKRIIVSKSGQSIEINPDTVILNPALASDNNILSKKTSIRHPVGIVELYNPEQNPPYSIYLVTNIKSPGNINAGTIIFELNTGVINSIMLETNPKEGLGNSGESYLIGRDYIMRSKSRFFPDSVILSKIFTRGSINALKKEEGTLIYEDYRNIEVLGSYGRLGLPDLDWYILAEIDLEESGQPIISNRNNILILTLIIAACVFILTYLLSRKITIPIVKLTEATKRISSGNYNEVVETVSNDEIGELTSTFNAMANTLRQQQVEIEHQRQKRSQAAIEALDNERLRLSRELHDSLGQTLISQKLRLESIDPEDLLKSAAIIEDVKKSIDLTINEVRHICNDLMPAVLFQFGLVNAIRKLCSDLNEFSGIYIDFHSDFTQETIDKKSRIYLFRITQEALKNAIEHSGCRKCTVELKNSNGFIRLKIKDNGIGISASKAGDGNGLINIRERVNLLNGQFAINTNKINGTELLIKVPY